MSDDETIETQRRSAALVLVGKRRGSKAGPRFSGGGPSLNEKRSARSKRLADSPEGKRKQHVENRPKHEVSTAAVSDEEMAKCETSATP